MPKVKLDCRTSIKRGAVTVQVANNSKTPVLAVHLTLRDAKTGKHILPAYYEENYFSLLPGKTREIQIESPGVTRDATVSLDGWNIE